MKTTIISIVILALLAIGGGFLWRSSTGASSPPQARKVLCYQDSMHPWIKSDRPGKCTICGMDLTPVYEGDKGFGGGENMVVLSSNNITVLNVQTEEVRRQSLRRALRVAGTIEPNEATRTIISAPAAGRIEDSAVDYAGLEVREGQRLVTFYSPELTQQKFKYLFRAKRATGQHDPTGGLAAQNPEGDPYYCELVAPQSGTVIERNVTKGQYVSEGERLFTIADASMLWFRFDVYEQQLPWLRLGQMVMVSLPAAPGKVFEAVISFIEPMLDKETRTVKVRADIGNPIVELDGNKQRLFKFGMYAEGVVQAEVPNRMAIPRTAVLRPGNAAYAYVDKGGGAFERRRIKLGQQGDELCEVLAGLEEGERVVTAGNVLLDGQAQLSQKGESEESDDAMDLTPATVVRLPAAASGTKEQTASDVSAAGAPTNRPAAPLSSNTRYRARKPTGLSAPDATSGRMLEGAMFSRMAELRNAELAEARAAKAGQESKLSKSQCRSLQEFLTPAAGVSQALAADDLALFNATMTKLPALVSQAQQALGNAAPWNELIRRVAEAATSGSATNMVEARQQFLPFSTTVVDLAKQLRKSDPEFAGLKIYHCPMAPKPGLWMQAQGPLHNPFYGAEMPTCGEEVRL